MRSAWSDRLLVVPVAVAAVLRVAVLVSTRPESWIGDGDAYRGIAAALLDGRLRPDVYLWGPGYPLLGALLSFLGGPGAGLIAASLLCGIALPAVVALAARAAGLPWTGLAAGLVLATYPDLVLASVRPLSESPALLVLVGCGICVEIARRTGRVRWAVAAGLLGGFGILMRAEIVLAFAALLALLGLAGRRRLRVVPAAAGCALLLLAPFLFAFHGATGQWGLSLKPHMNVIRTRIHTSASETLEARERWDAFLHRELQERGEFSPRKLADAVTPSEHLLRRETARTWLHHAALAARRSTWWERTLWIAGLAGLVLAGRAGRGVRWVAVLVGLPWLAVPIFLPYLGRHMLAAVPTLAWGTGALLARIPGTFAERRRRVAAWSVAGALVVACVLFVRVTARAAYDLPWTEMGWEGRLAVRNGDLSTAQRLVDEGLTHRPLDPRFHELQGYLLWESGDAAGAERSLREAVRLGGSPRSLAMLLVRAGRADEAEALVQDLRDRTSPAEYWGVAAEVAFAAQRWEDAAERFARVEELSGPSQETSLKRGTALLRSGHPEASLVPLGKAMEGPDANLRRQAEQLRTEAQRKLPSNLP